MTTNVAPTVLPSARNDAAARFPQEYPPRPQSQTWAETEQSRVELLERLTKPPLRPDSADIRRAMRRGLTALLHWLGEDPGQTWQDRWLASGAETAGAAWTDLVVQSVPALADRPPTHVRADLLAAMRLMLTGKVLRPGYRWLLRYRPSVLLEEARSRLDSTGFARLLAHCEATGRHNPLDRKEALNRITWILLNKGGRISDITVGDCVELNTALREYQCSGSNNRPLFYALLAETGVLPASSPPRLRAAQMPGQRTPAELVDKYALQNPSMRELFVSYLSERAAELDYASLVHMAHALCGLFWRDLEQHHPGIDSLHLETSVTTAWKERLKHVRDQDGRPTGDRVTARSQLLIIRAFYLDIARWAAEEPSRWATWAAPCPIKASECSLHKERKHRKAAMDQRTRARLPVLPALIRTAERERKETRARLDAALAASLGEVFAAHGDKFLRRRAAAGRIYVTDLATHQRRDLTFEEERAFWGWATIEVLRHTGVRIEELTELSHHSFIAYKLPSTGEVVPMLQIVPSKTDAERLLLVSPELGEVLAEIIHRVRGGRATLPLVAAYDPYDRSWSPPMPFLFQRPRGPEHRALSYNTIRRFLSHTLAVSGLTDATNRPLQFTPHDFRRLFATDALRSGLPPHIAAKILGHLDLGTTMGYAAIYSEDVVTHHRAFIARRRTLRPGEEYRDLTAEEWDQFLHHFELRKVALGVCTRDFGTPCVHEHSCVRCPLLRPDPAQEPRLLEIRDNLRARITEARREGWLGEIAGLEATLEAAEQKLQTMHKLSTRAEPTHLGMPGLPPSS
ncbi:site-specific integrase (plasmid) [Streptomyces sp. NBC_01450]|uniref:site-specific integrase n=1 Tax=Streptomyces sp. NBC_01450 TaxID=2903871 RepID=UPI002E35D752|nr:site-specific integrase [Streptomyces sp. NBC_01450]